MEHLLHESLYIRAIKCSFTGLELIEQVTGAKARNILRVSKERD